MTAKTKRAKPASDDKDALNVAMVQGESEGNKMARVMLEPLARHAHLAGLFGGKLMGDSRPPLTDTFNVLGDEIEKATNGDLSIASRLLASQALSLDAMFTELARRAALNMGEYLNAAERYGRLALKAQSNCRATLEALTKLHQPREQTVRHVHVNDGGQAIIADHFHHHTEGYQNAETAEQPHATGKAGVGSALLGSDPFGNGMPIPSREGEQAV